MANLKQQIEALQALLGGSDSEFIAYFKWEAAVRQEQIAGRAAGPEPRKPISYMSWKLSQFGTLRVAASAEIRPLVRGQIAFRPGTVRSLAEEDPAASGNGLG